MKFYRFVFDVAKSQKLRQTRGFGFEEIIGLIENELFVEVIRHPNSKNYPNQLMYELNINGYIHLVPAGIGEDAITLKTIFPSRKATKKYKRRIMYEVH